jgi:hypothetical protein
MWHTWGTADVYTELWLGDPTERDHLEDLGIVERIIRKWIFRNWDREAWTGLLRLRV